MREREAISNVEGLVAHSAEEAPMPITRQYHHSKRGNVLTWIYQPIHSPIVCVELYLKWYGLQLLHPNGKVEEVPFPDGPCPPREAPCCDHAPNPKVVQMWVKEKSYVLCDIALEFIIGRWETECRNNYPEPGEL